MLRAAGSDLEHVVKVNVYLINLSENFAPMNEAYLKVPCPWMDSTTCAMI